MNNGRKFSSNYSIPALFALLFCTITLLTAANYPSSIIFYSSLTRDTVPNLIFKTDSIPKNKTLRSYISPPFQSDTGKHRSADSTSGQQVDSFHVNISKDSLDAPVTYSAADSMILDVPTKKITLYSKANTKYKTMNLEAYRIELDQPKQLVVATFGMDTANKVIGRPHMEESDTKMDSDSIIYNIKTLKGITKSTFTNQGEMYVYGEKIKKISQNEFFAFRGRITTCNLDTPHFAFRTNKLKLINKKLAISGPIHPEFEGVPVPIYIPFGFFPLSQGRHSGILPPQFTANEQFGLGLEGLGYYKVLSDNFDATVEGNIYSYGGWRASLIPAYNVRYRYSGNMNLTLQRTRFLGNSAKQDFSTNQSFNITWSHVVNPKARPGQSFSASVNAGSTKFNQYVANNPTINFQNQLNSSISFQKNWDNKYLLSLSAGHDQNNLTRLLNIRLPDGSFTVNNFYPFQKKEFVGEPKWYEKFSVGLNSQFKGQTSFYDSAFSFHQLIDTFQWGAQNSIPITLSLPAIAGGALQVSPGIGLTQRVYAQKFIRSWNNAKGKLDTSIQKGAFVREDVSFSLSAASAIFGTFSKFGKNSNIVAIRHVLRPTVGFSYKPDLARADFYATRVDSAGARELRFSQFDGSLYGPFQEGRFGGITFGIDNNIEAKVRSKKDSTGDGTHKVKILDGFGFTGSYNILADSFKLSTLNLYARSTLFDKINITAGGILDPYITDKQGFRRDIYAWNQGKFSLGKLTSAQIAVSTSFKSKQEQKKTEQQRLQQQNNPDQGLPMTLEEQQNQLNYIRNNPAQFADFNIPWSVNISYSLNYVQLLRTDYSGFYSQITSNVNLSGDFSLSPKWKVGMSTYYDFKGASIQSLTMFISRDLHCWQMSINVTPVGLYRFFNITVSPKSSLLRDLKVNRTRYFYGGN